MIFRKWAKTQRETRSVAPTGAFFVYRGQVKKSARIPQIKNAVLFRL